MKHYVLKKHLVYSICLLWALIGFTPAYAQDNAIHVEGVVTDISTRETLIGVSVYPKNEPTKGTVTNIDGRYSLSVQKGTVLIFSYIGYENTEIIANSERVDVRLKEEVKALDEIVVIGYGTVKRKDVTTAISSVSTEDLDQRPIISAGQAMQGKAAGVSVIQPNGTPGGEISIRVRGTTSLNASNDPLYVVDGVPVDKIDFLAPTDIASMQILKDASSAAIYGSRAANGVVIITTKTGQKGEGRITFNAQLALSNVSNKIKSLNTAQYLDLMTDLGQRSAFPDNLTDQTDWFDETYSTGVTQSYQVSVSDGTEKLRYLLSAGYLDEKGVLNTAFYKRYNFRANVDNQIRKWLNISANIVYSDYSSNGIISGNGANRGGVVLSVVNTPTYAPIWDPANPGQYNTQFYGANITSPLENMARSENNKNKENRLIATGNLLFTILPELTFKSSFSIDRRNAVNTTFLDPYKTSWGRTQFGEGSDKRNMNTILTFDNVATYNKSFGLHGLEVMAGTSFTDSDYTNSSITGSHYRDGSIQTLNAANKINWSDGALSEGSQWGIMSYFGRVAYNYDSKYLLTVNMRRDGSSRLSPEGRWDDFPSVSAAWRMSSEEFMNGLDWLDDLKIRGGWGSTGNQSGLGDYAYLQLYNINRINWTVAGQEQSVPSISIATLRAKDLKWETTTQSNIGIDFTAFKNRLGITLDYYYKKTTDMLMKVKLPTGASQVGDIQRNEGTMINKGFEITINSRNLKGIVDWNTDFNISFNRNKLTKLVTSQVYTNGKTTDNVNEDVVRNIPGRSVGGFYGYISDGVDPETGELLYRDLNNDRKITATDRTYIGDPNPDFTFGMTNTFTWRNLSLSVFVQGSYGNDVYNASRMETEGMYDMKNQSTRVLDRWKIPGQITDIPKAGFILRNSSYFVEDGSYLRVKDISLSYNFKGNTLSKLGIYRLQPYFTASNLITWTSYKGMDPEVNQWGNSGEVQGIDWGTYPHSKSFVFGINVEF